MLWLCGLVILVAMPPAQEREPLELEAWADSPEWYLSLDIESHTVLGTAHHPQSGHWHTKWLVYRVPHPAVAQRKTGAFLTIDIPANAALLVVAMGSEEGSPETHVKGWVIASSQGYAAFRTWTHQEADAWELAWLLEQDAARAPHG